MTRNIGIMLAMGIGLVATARSQPPPLERAKSADLWRVINNPACTSKLQPFSQCTGGNESALLGEGTPATTKFGFKDSDGNVIIEPIYEDVKRFCDGLAAVKLEGKWGYINMFGETIIKPQFTDAGEFSEGSAPVKPEHRWTFINKEGAQACQPQYFFASYYSQGLAPVKRVDDDGNILSGYVNKQCEPVGPQNFDEAFPVQKGLGPVQKDGKWGFVSAVGKTDIKAIFDDYRFLAKTDGVVAVQYNALWGVLKVDGTWVVEPSLGDIKEFSEGLLAARYNKVWGYLNSDFKWQITPRFVSAGSFYRDSQYPPGPIAIVTSRYWSREYPGGTVINIGDPICRESTFAIDQSDRILKTLRDTVLDRQSCLE